MLKIWSSSPTEISNEIENVIKDDIELYCLQNDMTKMTPIKAKLISHDNYDLLVVDKNDCILCKDDASIFCYLTGNKTMRGFKAELDMKNKLRLFYKFPTRIFDIQRRRSPRAPASKDSIANFFFSNKRRVNTGTVEDISMRGAKLATDIPAKVTDGDAITALTLLNFYEKFYTGKESRLQIPEAWVSWSTFSGNRTTAMGVRFTLPEENRPTMADYLAIRSKDLPEK